MSISESPVTEPRLNSPLRQQLSRIERLVHLLFDISVIAKGIDGVLEIIGGALLFAVNPVQLNHIVRLLTQHELTEDPHDLVAGYLLHAAKHLSAGVQIFGAVYLLGHGVIKVGLVAALLRRQLWAYPAAMLAFLLFLIYQLYRYSHAHALWLLALSAVDVFIIVITWFEYRRLRTTRGFA
jgi:uncharacterized membrane protein